MRLPNLRALPLGNCIYFLGFPGGSGGQELARSPGHQGSVPGLGRSLEEGMATHSRILAWRISMDKGAWWVQSMGSHRVGQD